MNGMPRLVSVIIGTHDRPALLREALASIRALEGPDLTFEILVGDNGSTPETRHVVAEFGGIYEHTDKIGCAAARNLAMRRISGEFIAFLDDDDVWLPEHIRPHIALLDAQPEYQAVFGQIVSTNEDREPIGEPWPSGLPADGKLFDVMLSGYFPQVGGTVARASTVQRHGLMDESLIGDCDWDWHLRIAASHQIGFVAVPCVLFRQRPAGSFDDLQRKRAYFTKKIFFRHASGFSKPGWRAVYTAYRGALIRTYDYFTGAISTSVQEGDFKRARRGFWSALSILPPVVIRDLLSGKPLRSDVLRSFRISVWRTGRGSSTSPNK
jgi:glycosyltransferase involved in cell wall biosynthesis